MNIFTSEFSYVKDFWKVMLSWNILCCMCALGNVNEVIQHWVVIASSECPNEMILSCLMVLSFFLPAAFTQPPKYQTSVSFCQLHLKIDSWAPTSSPEWGGHQTCSSWSWIHWTFCWLILVIVAAALILFLLFLCSELVPTVDSSNFCSYQGKGVVLLLHLWLEVQSQQILVLLQPHVHYRRDQHCAWYDTSRRVPVLSGARCDIHARARRF